MLFILFWCAHKLEWCRRISLTNQPRGRKIRSSQNNRWPLSLWRKPFCKDVCKANSNTISAIPRSIRAGSVGSSILLFSHRACISWNRKLPSVPGTTRVVRQERTLDVTSLSVGFLHYIPCRQHNIAIPLTLTERTGFDLKTVISTTMSPMSLQVTGRTDGDMTEISLRCCVKLTRFLESCDGNNESWAHVQCALRGRDVKDSVVK